MSMQSKNRGRGIPFGFAFAHCSAALNFLTLRADSRFPKRLGVFLGPDISNLTEERHEIHATWTVLNALYLREMSF